MKLPPYPFIPRFQVYVFVRENEQFPGISLGYASYQQGTVYGKFTIPRENIGGYSYSFQNLEGLLNTDRYRGDFRHQLERTYL